MRKKRARRLRPADHDMREPGREAMARIVPHRALFGSDPERIGNAAAGPLVVGREGNADVAVVENAIMLAVCLFDLIERLGDQESADEIGRAWCRERVCQYG